MSDFEKIYDFNHLYQAHKVARRGKRDTQEVIDFELDLSLNLTELSLSLKNKTYKMSGYYYFTICDPKVRIIYALHYVDRVVQHCLCDEVLAPLLEKRLIYDNSACRKGKGTHFALKRVCHFMSDFYRKYGLNGYVLKADVSKFFDSIDHVILKSKIRKVINDKDVLWLLDMIIDSYETEKGKGLPMGNQTSQWFAIYYLDEMDRLIKEKFRIHYYSRYMDDCILIHQSKDTLNECLNMMNRLLHDKLLLSFNSKTCIYPFRHGITYLGWRLTINDSGKIFRKVKKSSKQRMNQKLKEKLWLFQQGMISKEDVQNFLVSIQGYLKFQK